MQDSYPQNSYQQDPYQQNQYQQNQYQQNPYQQGPNQRRNAPGAVASLVLGIVSIVTCWCYGIVGLVTGIIGLVLGNKARRAANANPELFKGAGLYNTGRGLSIAGIVLGALCLLIGVIVLIAGGSYFLSDLIDLW